MGIVLGALRNGYRCARATAPYNDCMSGKPADQWLWDAVKKALQETGTPVLTVGLYVDTDLRASYGGFAYLDSVWTMRPTGQAKANITCFFGTMFLTGGRSNERLALEFISEESQNVSLSLEGFLDRHQLGLYFTIRAQEDYPMRTESLVNVVLH